MQYSASRPLWGDDGVSKARGHEKTHKERVYLPIWHPSYILRNPQDKTKWTNDLRRANSLLTGKEATAYSSKGKSKHLDNLDRVLDFLRYLRKKHRGPVSLDIEASNLNRVGSNKILSIQFAYNRDKGYVIVLEHKKSPWSSSELKKIKKELKRTLEHARHVDYWITHTKFDYAQLSKRYGIVDWSAPIVDTSFMAHLLDDNRAKDTDTDGNEHADGYKLGVLAEEWLMFMHYQATGVKQRRHEIEKVPFKDFIEYGGMDAYVTFRLHDYCLEEAEKQKYRNKLLRLAIFWGSRMITMIPTMEQWGIHVDKRQLFMLKGKDSPIRKRVAELTAALNSSKNVKAANKALVRGDKKGAGGSGMRPLFGKTDPWVFDSNKRLHLLKLFIDVMGLKPVAFGKERTREWPEGVPKIDKHFLKSYAPPEDKPPYPRSVTEVRELQELRGLSKLESSYINSILEFLETNPDCADGRLRASFSIINTVTGRWASMEPNLQQVPRPDNPAKAAVKSLYRAAKNCLLLEADYGQAEIRWWAQIAGDKKFAERFKEMKALREEYLKNPTDELKAKVKAFCDIHRQVAALMFGLDIQKVSDDQRQAAKSLAFGSIYGQSHYTLAEILKITPDEALEVQNKFLQAFPEAGQWLTSIEKDVERRGYVESPFGRRRRLHAMLASNIKGMVGAAKRRARNSPIQSASSDTTGLAAWLMLQYIKKHNKPWKIVDVVHDAILLEVPADYEQVYECARVLKRIMTEDVFKVIERDFGYKTFVPFEADFKLGIALGAMSKDLTEANLKSEVKRLKKVIKQEAESGWTS